MSNPTVNNRPPEIQFEGYQIRVQGTLDPSWSEWLDCHQVIHNPSGETTLTCQVPDQTALHGLLAKIRDMNLKLISVIRIESESMVEGLHHDHD